MVIDRSFLNFVENTVVHERNLLENGVPIKGEKAAVSEQVVGRVPWSVQAYSVAVGKAKDV
jgi:hypothetical protein